MSIHLTHFFYTYKIKYEYLPILLWTWKNFEKHKRRMDKRKVKKTMKILRKMMFATLVLALIIATPAILVACGKDKGDVNPPVNTETETPVVPTAVSVMFNGNGGRVEIEPLTLEPNQKIELPNTGASKAYSQFLGWNTDRYAKTGFFTYNITTRDVTFYAIWRTEKADVRFVSNEGGVSLPALMNREKGSTLNLWSYLDFNFDTTGINIILENCYIDHFLVNGEEKLFNETIVIEGDTTIEPVFLPLERVNFPVSESITSLKLKNGSTKLLSTINASNEIYEIVLPNPRYNSYEAETGEEFIFVGWTYLEKNIQGGSFNQIYKANNLLQPGDEFLIQSYSNEIYFYPMYVSLTEGNSSLAYIYNKTTDSYSVKQIDRSHVGIVVLPEEYLGKPVTMIADEGFLGSNSSVMIIPQSITTIGKKAFKDSKLVYVHFKGESQITEIPEQAFSGNSYMKKFKFPESVEYIGERAFYDTKLKKVVFPTSTSYTIGEYAFSNLTYGINFSSFNNLNRIEKYAFYNTFFIPSIGDSYFHLIIPETVSSIEEGAFRFNNENINTQLKTVTFEGGGPWRLEDYAFYGHQGLQSVVLPQYMGEIGNYTFARTGLSEIIIPEYVSNIGEGAFSEMKNFEDSDIRIEFKTQYNINLGAFCFKDSNNIKEIIINAQDVNFGNGALYCYNTRYHHLSIIFSRTDVVVNIASDGEGYYSLSSGLENNASLDVPSNLIGTYKSMYNNLESYFLEYVVENQNINYEIDYDSGFLMVVYTNYQEEYDLVIPEYKTFDGFNYMVGKIRSYGFYDNYYLTNIDFNGVFYISSYSFVNCPNLTTLYFRSTEHAIVFEENWFENCNNLQSVYFANSYIVENLKSQYSEYAYLFKSATDLINPIDFHTENHYIDDYGYVVEVTILHKNPESTTQATEIIIDGENFGGGIVYISGNGFYGMEHVTSFTIRSINKISAFAFSDCPNLESITIESCNVIEIENDIFNNSPNVSEIRVYDWLVDQYKATYSEYADLFIPMPFV